MRVNTRHSVAVRKCLIRGRLYTVQSASGFGLRFALYVKREIHDFLFSGSERMSAMKLLLDLSLLAAATGQAAVAFTASLRRRMASLYPKLRYPFATWTTAIGPIENIDDSLTENLRNPYGFFMTRP